VDKKLNSNEKNRKYYVDILDVSDLKQKRVSLSKQLSAFRKMLKR
jgi:hypothetical protein